MHAGYLCAFALTFGAIFASQSAASVIDSSGAGFSINDNDSGGATSTISVGADEVIDNVQVDLFGLNHTWVGDLIARVTSPTGTTADLFVRVGPGFFGDSSNLQGNYSFADGGIDFASTASSLNGGQTLPSATYQPATNGDGAISLASAFAGESTMGDWTLFISDNAGQDTGALGGWGVTISSTATAIPEPGSGILIVFVGIAALQRRKRDKKRSRTFETAA